MTDKPLLPVVAWTEPQHRVHCAVLDRTRGPCDCGATARPLTDHAAATEALTQSQERIEALERDARRYRAALIVALFQWGRLVGVGDEFPQRWADWLVPASYDLGFPDDTPSDALIDAALSPSEPGA